jgi:ribosomal protein S21
MLGPDPIDEGTMSGNTGASMQIGSAFIQRPRNQFGISQWEKVGEEQGADKTIPRVGVDNQEKPAYTMDDLLRQAAQLEATDDGGEIPTKLQKKLRKDSPAYAEPGEFDAASGGTAPGKKRKVKVEGDLDEGSRSLKRLARKEKAANKGKNPGYFEKVSSHEKKSADSRRRYAAGPGKGIEAGVAFDDFAQGDVQVHGRQPHSDPLQVGHRAALRSDPELPRSRRAPTQRHRSRTPAQEQAGDLQGQEQGLRQAPARQHAGRGEVGLHL